MIVRITDTPDRKFLGQEFDSESNPIILGEDISIFVEKIIMLPEDGIRFINSSYIIDTKKV